MYKTKRISKSGTVSELDFSNYIASFDIAFAHTAKAMQFLRKLPFPAGMHSQLSIPIEC